MRQASYNDTMVSQVDMKTGRVGQKLRTRKALISAAWELLAKGEQPTIEEVADLAMISRATAYRYFPNRERLFIEAVLSREAVSSERVLGSVAKGSPGERVARVQEHIYGLILKNETLYRSLLRSCQEEWMGNKDRYVLRGDQRLELLEAALESDHLKIPDKEAENLTFALAAMVSVESYVALRDVCQLSRNRSREVMNWAVRKMVEAVLSGKAE